MARITMRNSQKATFAEVFEIYISAVTARGVKDKTIATYKQHFHAISKRLDVSMPINRLTSTVLDNMILQMRKEGLSDSSINSYTRTLKCFLSWCNEEGYTKANLKIYKAAETVKETYTDEELLTLLKKPEADCKFCEYRNLHSCNSLLQLFCAFVFNSQGTQRVIPTTCSAKNSVAYILLIVFPVHQLWEHQKPESFQCNRLITIFTFHRGPNSRQYLQRQSIDDSYHIHSGSFHHLGIIFFHTDGCTDRKYIQRKQVNNKNECQ